MNKQQLKSYLAGIKYEKQYYEQRLIENNRLKREIEKLKSAVAEIGNQRFRERSAVTIDELSERQLTLNSELMDILAESRKHEYILELLLQPYKLIIYYRYFLSYSFDKIASLLNYSDKRIYQLHAEAIEILADKLDKY